MGDLSTHVLDGPQKPDSYSDDDDDYETRDYLSTREGYEMLTSKNFRHAIIRGRGRIKSLLLYSSEMVPVSAARLEELDGYFTELLNSMKKLGTKNDAAEKERLIVMTKKILREWESIEGALQPVHADYPHPQAVPSAWLFEVNWRDEAYQEILILRKKYSHLLDQAYLRNCTSFVKMRGGLRGGIALSIKKILKFVASSREDINLMSVTKCYKRVMGIKEVCIPVQQPLGTQKLTDEIQLPYWRDEIYEQIVDSRKMYSLKLEQLLRDEVNRMKSSVTPDAGSSERRSFLEDSLEFLANFRDGLAFLSQDFCQEQLKDIKLFMETLPPANQQATPQSPGQNRVANELINWRDLEYEMLQNKRFRFNHELYDVYLKYQPAWSKMPACDEHLKKLESHMKILWKFYNMSRGEMALWCECKDGYYRECWLHLRKVVEETIDLMKLLVGSLEVAGSKPTWSCKGILLIPKEDKLFFQMPLNPGL